MANLLTRLGAALAAFGDPKQRGFGADLFVRAGDLDADPSSLGRPYEKSVWVQRAIKEIAGPIAAVELKFYEGEEEIVGAPWLNFWQRPVAGLTHSDFIEALTGWLKLAGEAFIILPEEFGVRFPEAMRAWPQLGLIRPDAMRAVKDSAGRLIAWQYQTSKGLVKFPVEQVIQPRYWNPYDPDRGMSEYEAARVASEADYMAGKFALNMCRANGDTGMVITMKDGASLTDEQQQQVREQLRAKQAKARRGEYASVFVPADLQIQDPVIRAPDAQFVAQRLQNRHEIYIAFGVPPSMADVVASYSVGSASDWYRLISGTCVPVAAKIADAIGQIASRMHGRPVEAYFEFDDHPIMQQVRRERIDAWTKLVDRGMPGELASEALDLSLPEYPAGKVGLIPFSLAPFGATPEPTADPDLAEPEIEADPVTEAVRALQLPRPRKAIAAPPCEHCGGLAIEDLQVRAGDSADVKLWKSIVSKRRESMRAYESKFTATLMTARREVLAKLERAETKTVTRAATVGEFIFDLGNFSKLFHAQMRTAGMNALQAAGTQVMAELGKDDPWTMPAKEAVDFLRNRENRLTGVPNDVHERIKGVLEAGITEGDSLRDIAKAVRAEFNDIGAQRAHVIASTETAAAYGTARDLALREAGVQWKRWLSSGNDNVRAAHSAMNGDIVGIDELFTVVNPATGEVDLVKHPADPNGQPWNVINCHCVEVGTAGPTQTEP